MANFFRHCYAIPTYLPTSTKTHLARSHTLHCIGWPFKTEPPGLDDLTNWLTALDPHPSSSPSLSFSPFLLFLAFPSSSLVLACCCLSFVRLLLFPPDGIRMSMGSSDNEAYNNRIVINGEKERYAIFMYRGADEPDVEGSDGQPRYNSVYGNTLISDDATIKMMDCESNVIEVRKKNCYTPYVRAPSGQVRLEIKLHAMILIVNGRLQRWAKGRRRQDRSYYFRFKIAVKFQAFFS